MISTFLQPSVIEGHPGEWAGAGLCPGDLRGLVVWREKAQGNPRAFLFFPFGGFLFRHLYGFRINDNVGLHPNRMNRLAVWGKVFCRGQAKA